MRTHSKSVSQLLALSLSGLLALPALEAQTLPTQLNIVIVEGEGTTNTAGERVAREPAVRIEDENHRAIAEAAAVFTLPTEGATGEFSNGAKNIIVMTDRSGVAVAHGLKLNQVSGRILIHINASYRGLTASTTMTEFSILRPGQTEKTKSGGRHGTLIAILIIAGAAAAGGGAYAATHKSSSSSPSTVTSGPAPIGITPGTGTITGGQ